MAGTEVPVSLTDAVRANAPQAFGALYDEYAGGLYAYCHVMVGDEAGDALRDVFVTIARHPDAAPDDDARLPPWLYSLARAECVRRGALARGVVTTRAADPLRHALALLSPQHREALALSNALDPEQTAEVLGVAPDTAETLVREAQRRLEQAAASVGGRETQDSALLTSLSGEALRRLVTLGHEPSAGHRSWVLSSCAAAGRTPGEAAVFDVDGTPLPPDAFSAQADDATHQFPMISTEEPPTAPLRQVGGVSAGARPDQPGSAELGLAGPVPAGSGSAGGEFMGASSAEDPDIRAPLARLAASAYKEPGIAGEPPPRVRGTHAKQSRPFPRRRLLTVVGLVACVAAVTGTALAWPASHRANEAGSLVRQSVPPSRSAEPAPPADQASPPPRPATSTPGASPTPTPTHTAAAPRWSKTTPDKDSATPAAPPEPAPTAEPTPRRPPTTRPKPHHTPRACHGTPGRAYRCVRPHPWHSQWRGLGGDPGHAAASPGNAGSPGRRFPDRQAGRGGARGEGGRPQGLSRSPHP
jgi:DNA-directed RNA polymerase specialized sigma24 family protein